jgi:hypothetical protein
MSKEDKNIRVITFSKYVKPEPVENVSRGWALNGRNNSFYDYVIDRYRGSTTNSSIIDSYVDLVYGRGLGVRNSLQNTDAFVRLASILSAKDLKRLCFDYVMFGELSSEVIETKGKELSSIKHIPKNLVVPSLVDEDNEIKSYWFSRDWSKQHQNKPIEIPAFGYKKAPKTIYNLKPYTPNCVYFANPAYFSGLQYCESEEEISNLYLSSIKNGLSGGYIINVPDGVNLQPEEKDAFERSVKQRLTGSTNASNFIISFNGRDIEVTITPFPVNDNIHKQWEFLTTEATQKILTAHRATSPSLVGIISSSGFSNTADEMDMAEKQLMKRVIKPKQDAILEAIEEILVAYGINLDLYFKPLTEEVTATPTQLSEQCNHEKKNDDLEALLGLGEDEDLENYDIADECEVDYEEDIKLARVVSSNPNNKSEDDNKDVLIRYRYAGRTTGERDFCNRMINANKVFRKEDIIAAKDKVVNPGWGLNGANTYSIWLYKGGGNCYHKWNRVIYLKKDVKIDVNSPLAETISTSKARQKGFKVPVNESKVSVAPIRMPNQGFVNK